MQSEEGAIVPFLRDLTALGIGGVVVLVPMELDKEAICERIRAAVGEHANELAFA